MLKKEAEKRLSIQEIRRHSYVCMCVDGGREEYEAVEDVCVGEEGARESYPDVTILCVSFVPGGLCTSIQDPSPWRSSTSHPTLIARTTIGGQLCSHTWRFSTSTILLRTEQILVGEGVRGEGMRGEGGGSEG